MADGQLVTPTNSYTVAADDIGGTSYQRVKLVYGPDGTNSGDVDTTNPLPIGGTITVANGVSVSAQVSGTVTVSNGHSVTIQQGASVSAVVSGTVTVSNGASVTIQQGVSVSAVVSGTVTALLAQTTTTQVAATGLLVWLAPTQTLSVNVGASTAVATTTQAAVTGAVVWLAPTQTVNVTVADAVFTTTQVAATGLLVWLAPTQTISVAIGASTAVATTTQAAVTGAIVWLAPTQTITVANGASVTIQQGASVSAVVSGSVSLLNVVVTTTATSGVSGPIVWLGHNQTVGVVNTISSVLTIVTQLGTQIVSVVPGLSVSAVVSGTVSVTDIGALYTTTGIPAAASTGQIVVVKAGFSGTVTVLNGASVTIQQGASVSAVVSGTVSLAVSQTVGTVIAVSGVTAVSVISTIVTILGTQIVTVAGGTTVVSGTVTANLAEMSKAPVVIAVSQTVIGSSTTVLFTVWTGGTNVTAGASFWVVPAGKTFRILAMNYIGVSSAVLGAARFCVLLGTAAASVSVVATVGIPAMCPFAIQASTTPFMIQDIFADVAAGTTVGLGVAGGTSHTLLQAVVQGYLFP